MISLSGKSSPRGINKFDMLHYITSNPDKVRVAKKYLEEFGIHVEQKHLDLTEIQSESIEEIALHKARQAYEKCNHPLFVMDAGWYIPSLNGFPGPYMKYVNDWFSSDNLLALMKDKADRSILYKEVFYYIDENETKQFIGEKSGKILHKPEGEGILSWKIISLRSDGKSIAQAWKEKAHPVDSYTLWEEFATWYNNHILSHNP